MEKAADLELQIDTEVNLMEENLKEMSITNTNEGVRIQKQDSRTNIDRNGSELHGLQAQ